MSAERARFELAAEPVLRALLDALTRSNIGYVVIEHRDGAMRKLDANDAAMRNLGYTREEWLSYEMFDIIAPHHRDATAQLYERLVAGESLTASFEVVILDKHGLPITLEVSYGRADAAGGHVFVLIWSDRGSHAPLQLSSLEADRVSLVGALAAGFAHETNNPLTSVLLNLRSLRKLVTANLADAKQVAALRVLDDIATGAERIATNVRAFQTLASRGRSQPVDLVAVTTAVLRLATPTIEPRAHVVRKLSAVRPVVGEESRVAQAVLAMLLFAVSGFAAGDAANQIEVVVEERGDHDVVVVSDNGAELSADELARAFDPLFRPASRSAELGGGLAVARSVALSFGGDVELAARPGGGATITMVLPITATVA